MSHPKSRAIEGRGDLSRFVVHLTRDDSADDPNGASAAENFTSIVKQRKILAIRPHCLHGRKIPNIHKERFSVCCFTEVPLSELHLLARHIPGRKIQLSEYGFVFSRDFLVSKGAQPAIYINSYNNNTWSREAAERVYQLSKKSRFKKDKLWRLLPFLNAMHEGYDFAWEREWRLLGDLDFKPKDVISVILPEHGETDRKREFMKSGVPVISLGWSTEKLVSEFSDQARRARRTWIKKSKTKSNPKKGK